MEDIEELAKSKEYKNYNSVNTALSLIGQCLEPYTKQRLESVHNQITKKLGGPQPCNRQCSRNAHYNRWCPTCSAWKKELESFLKNPRKINWWKMESWNWPLNAVNIAEVFMPLTWNAGNIHLKDLSTAVNIWSNCTEFPGSIVNDIKPIRQLRNVHNHTDTQRITDGDKTNMFITIFNTLNVPDVKAEIYMYNQLVQTLQELEQHGITTKEVKEATDRIEKMLLIQSNRLERKMKTIDDDVKQINEKLNIYSRYFICLLVVVMPFILAVTISALRGQVNNTGTVQRDSYKYSNEDCLSEEPHTSFQEQAIHMYGYISKHSTLIGRKWLFERLDKHLKENRSNHGVMVIAGTGYGKSALAANIICASPTDASYSIRKNLAAYYICRFDSLITKKTHIFIRRLASMFSLHIPGFAEVLRTTEKLCLEYYNPNQCEGDPGGCIKHCLISPLERLKAQDKHYIVVLDALDECEDSDKDDEIALLLRSNLYSLPEWIKFIVTCRNVSSCRQLNTQLYAMELNHNDPENQNDLNKYYISQGVSHMNTDALNFLLASFSISMSGIPSLDIFYEQQFRRLYRNQYQEPKAILEIMCASFEAMTEKEIFDVLSNTVTIAPENYDRSLLHLSHFIQTLNGNIHLWHISLRNWLINTNSYFIINVSKGHHYIAKYLLNQLQSNPENVDIVQLVSHASLAKPFSEESLQRFDELNFSDLIKQGYIKINYPVHGLACQCNNFVAMQHLVKHFPDLEVLNDMKVTPVYVASSQGNIETLKALVGANASTDFRIPSTMDLVTLYTAYLYPRSSPTPPPPLGYGILDIAAQKGHLPIVKYIVENLNYNFNKKNGLNLLPIHLSCMYGHTSVIKYMYKKQIVTLDSRCLYFASEKGHVDLVSYLLEMGVDDKCKECESVYFLSRGKYQFQGQLNENYVMRYNWDQITCETALHAAVRLNHIEISTLLINNSFSKKSVLCCNRAGQTPLGSAVLYNRENIAKIFLEYKLVNTTIKCSPRHILNVNYYNYMKKQKLTDPFSCDGCTVMHVVAFYDRMWFVKLLGNDNDPNIWNAMDDAGCYPAHTAACLGSTQVLNYLLGLDKSGIHEQKCKNGSTPIEIAVSCKSAETFIILLNSSKYQRNHLIKGMKKSVIFNALNESMEGQITEEVFYVQLRIEKIIEAVLSPEWNLGHKNKFQQNILHIALLNGHFVVLKKLFSTSPGKSKQLMTEKDSNSKMPLDLAITNLGDNTEIDIYISNTSLGGLMTSMELTIFIALDFVEKNNLTSHMNLKKMILALARKNYFLLVMEILRIHKWLYSDNDFVYDALVEESTNLFSSVILMQLFSYRQNNTKGSLVCINNCDATLKYCHLHTIARKYLEVAVLLNSFEDTDNNSKVDEILMTGFKLNVNFPGMLSTCFDKEGFNVLDRAIQGSSHRLTKYLLDIGVRSSKQVVDLIRLAFTPFKSSVMASSEAVVYTKSSQNVGNRIDEFFYHPLAKFKRSFEMTETNKIWVFTSNETKTSGKCLTFSNIVNWSHNERVIVTLIRHFHHSLQSHSFCFENGKQFSLVHIAAMHGFDFTLSEISKYFGIDVLSCSNYHSITPILLAKALNRASTVEFLYRTANSPPAPIDHTNFYLQFFLTFLKRSFGEKHIMCIFDFHNVMPKNMYRILKASLCFRKVAKTFKDDLAAEKGFLMMRLYTLFQLKHICSSKCKEIGQKWSTGPKNINTDIILQMKEEPTFKSFAKEMDFYMISFLRYRIETLKYRIEDGEHINFMINESKYFISQLIDKPSDYRYCMKYWCDKHELFCKDLSFGASPHLKLNERYIFGSLKHSFRGLVMILKARIAREIELISKKT
ncbi:uncharacterized protein LOC123534430 isoform X2 [Mercenaria mercenaria]|uniref:uncharacterized protein LOC123534430 isoform X2 n=1 Tax=Mercenaria mercenaria TaxID=6596 RepID=UPI00234F630A|nr:uncharacterized protein LOC123534430 isoform X2 [Mercenaria mercenaria]